MLICCSWMASQSLPANSSKMAAWGGGRRRPRGDPAELQKSNVRNAHTPRRRPQNKYHALCPQPQKTGVGPSDAGPARRKGRRPAAGPPGRPRFRRFPGNHPTYSADPSARSAPAASDEALLCAEAGASSPEEHGRRPVEAEGLTLLVKGFSGAGHPPLGPVPVQIAVLNATTTTAVRRRETENVRYF